MLLQLIENKQTADFYYKCKQSDWLQNSSVKLTPISNIACNYVLKAKNMQKNLNLRQNKWSLEAWGS